MKFLLIAILLVSVTLAGCSGARIYTFKEERVDQRVEGNRGYIKGTPAPEPIRKGVAKRTLIGIDVEVPILPGEKGYVPTSGGTVIYAEDIKMEPMPRAPKKKAPKAKVVYREETIIVEEEITPEGKKKEIIVEEEEVWVK
ncbi:MAG: hypothetical protein WBC74_00230 [Candidatus Omnitrophota bacterium]